MVASIVLVSGNGHELLYSLLSSRFSSPEGTQSFQAKNVLKVPVSPGTSGCWLMSPTPLSFLSFNTSVSSQNLVPEMGTLAP